MTAVVRPHGRAPSATYAGFFGYVRVSMDEPDSRGQHDELNAAGCARIWTDTRSGALARRPKLEALLDYADDGDTIVITRLDASAGLCRIW